MINVIGCLTAFVLGLILSQVEFISSREAKILTVLGWVIALYFATTGEN